MHKKILICSFITVIITALSVGVHAESYHVGPGDILEISVWRDENLSRQLVITPDSILSYPLIGDVNVANMSVAEIRTIITKKLAEYVPDASVAVMVKEIKSLNAYVIGQVKDPGVYPISMNTRVMQALAMAKGLTPFASERDIHILRYKGKSIEKISFDYKAVLKGENLDQDILLERGDVIVVP
jgi:polysaccharide export outer membrane protein